MGFSMSTFISIYSSHIQSLQGPKHHSLSSMSFPQNPSNSRFRIPSKQPFNGDFKIHHKNSHVRRNSSPIRPNFTVRASSEKSQVVSPKTRLIVISSAITVVLAVANRVLYKLALVPMKNHPFFLAQFATFGYVAIYFSILYVRYRAGVVTDEMIAIPKWRFVAIGVLEALGVASGMASAAMLPGPAIPILSQTFLVWQLAFSTLLLGRRYSVNQIAGCLLVAAGVVVAVARSIAWREGGCRGCVSGIDSEGDSHVQSRDMMINCFSSITNWF